MPTSHYSPVGDHDDVSIMLRANCPYNGRMRRRTRFALGLLSR
jgi:hypothetical protein